MFVVDDDRPARDSLQTLVESVGLQFSGFDSAEDFLKRYTPEDPGCLVLDLRMPGMDGLDLQSTLNNRDVELPIIFITGHGEVAVAVQALQGGAVDFLEKPCGHRELLKRIYEALELDAQRRPIRARRIELDRRIASLSPREREVLDLVIEGKHTKQISTALSVAPKTVDTHRANIMQKLQVDSLPALFRLVLSAQDTG